MFCKKCGAELPNDAAFCEKCGAPVATPEPVNAPAADAMNQPVPTVTPSAPAEPVTPSAEPAAPVNPAEPAAPVNPGAPAGPGMPVNPAGDAGAAPAGFTQPIPAEPAPPQKSKRGLIIGIIAAVVIVLIILLAAIGLSGGGGGGADPIIGEWELFAIIDSENTDNITAVPSGSGSIEFESNGDLTLIIDGEPYTGTWEQDSDLTDRLDDATGYSIDFDELPAGSVSFTKVSGEDSVLLLIPGISYGMSFQK